MVKGVNKTVIEVNNTGSKLFEKIVFYVTPEYGNLNAKQLRRAVSSFAFQYDEKMNKSYLRKKYIKRRRIFIASALGVLISAVATVLMIIL